MLDVNFWDLDLFEVWFHFKEPKILKTAKMASNQKDKQ